MNSFKSAFILGSTSTVAKSICLKLASDGCKKFHLVCRNLEKNKFLVEELRKKYNANVTQEQNDVLLNISLKKFKKVNVEYFDLYIITIGYLGEFKHLKILP